MLRLLLYSFFALVFPLQCSCRESTHNNTMFVNGDLKGKFIMDRNLGARDTNFASDGKGVLHYQFGRKDATTTDATSIGTNAYIGNGNDKWSIATKASPVTTAEAVTSPMIYFTRSGGNWCSDVSSVSYVWLDYEADVDRQDKSIFDPSPKGWKIMPNGALEGLTRSSMTDWVSDEENSNIGRSYPLADDKYAYYPPYGIRVPSTGNMMYYSVYTWHWSSTASSATLSYGFKFNLTDTVFNNPYSGARTDGLTVRCVQHDEE